jgi:hypothetical protein
VDLVGSIDIVIPLVPTKFTLSTPTAVKYSFSVVLSSAYQYLNVLLRETNAVSGLSAETLKSELLSKIIVFIFGYIVVPIASAEPVGPIPTFKPPKVPVGPI